MKTTFNRENLFKTLQQVVERKEQIQKELERVEKENKLVRQQSFKRSVDMPYPRTTIFDESDGDDEKDLQAILKPHKYLLTFPREQAYLAKQFEQFMLEQQRSFQVKCMVALLVVFIFQTLVIIAVRANFNQNEVIIPLRFIYCLFLLGALLVPKWLFDKNLRTATTFVLFTYGAIVILYQAHISNQEVFFDDIHTIQILELAFLYLIAVNCR